MPRASNAGSEGHSVATERVERKKLLPWTAGFVLEGNSKKNRESLFPSIAHRHNKAVVGDLKGI